MSEPSLFVGGVGEPVPVEKARGEARVQMAVRNQVLLAVDLDSVIALDHRARIVWDFVQGLDLTCFYDRIKSVEGAPGRAAIDPAILVSLWLYATLEGVGSARAVDRLCEFHDGYRWLCGGVSVNYHTLASFRSGSGKELDRILSESVAGFRSEGLVRLGRVAQDGVRVRAEAGKSSFHRKSRLMRMAEEAEAHVERLKKELHEDPAASERRIQAARKRAAHNKAARVKRALKARDEVATAKEKDSRRRAQAEKSRGSTTDPDARVMKMGDGGSRPAYNAQFATDTESRLIVGVDVTNVGNDGGQMAPMVEQIEQRLGKVPDEMLVDGGYVKHSDIEEVASQGTKTCSPVPTHENDKKGPHEPHDGDGPGVIEWRQRMATEEARQVYKLRASTAEWTNALARNRGLRRVFVRGLEKVKTILLWFALAHNLMQVAALRRGAVQAA
jgi:transposase